MQEKHLARPIFNSNLTELWPVYFPDTIVVYIEDLLKTQEENLFLHKDILELYFSNKKRSNGGTIKNVYVNEKKQSASLTFEDF